jgi:ParB-like chromosome segregation protein Spo0J
MRVIDGNHRLMAAAISGRQEIDVEFFDGSSEDAFLKAVEANLEHGLPLTQADRAAAALRILKSYPAMSDRAVAKSTGLTARAVAEVRRSSAGVPESDVRVGRDGKVRPLNAATGRLRVAALMKERPEASVRQVAVLAGVSPATALDVRRRLKRGEEPVPGKGAAAQIPQDARPPEVPRAAETAPAVTLEHLMRDPSLRQSELGRRLLRMFKENELGAKDMVDIAHSVPSHCIELAVRISWHNSQIWAEFAQQLDHRAQDD